MYKKNEFTMNIGLPSIMLIFIVLCLVSFGILSLVSSNSDKQLSQKVLTRSTAYYNACNLAEEMLCDVNELLNIAYETSDSREAYFDAVNSIPLTYKYEISDIQYLFVQLSFNYPKSKNNCLYNIDYWKVVTKDNLDYDTGLDLIEIY